VPELASISHVQSAFVFPYILTAEYPILLLGNKVLAAAHDLFQILNFQEQGGLKLLSMSSNQ
jgi:hypothetical protein